MAHTRWPYAALVVSDELVLLCKQHLTLCANNTREHLTGLSLQPVSAWWACCGDVHKHAVATCAIVRSALLCAAAYSLWWVCWHAKTMEAPPWRSCCAASTHLPSCKPCLRRRPCCKATGVPACVVLQLCGHRC